jgi:Na+-driven multidrug efflux pump
MKKVELAALTAVEEVHRDDTEHASCRDLDDRTAAINELKSLLLLAYPIIGSYMLQLGLGLVNVLAVGRLGVVELDGAALGQLLANITGMSVVFGLLMAMDTLAPQAIGAGNIERVGVLAQRGAVYFHLLSWCVPARCIVTLTLLHAVEGDLGGGVRPNLLFVVDD